MSQVLLPEKYNLPIFVVLGLEHSIANMYIIPQGLILGANGTISDFIIKNLIPVTIGNMISGILFVGIVFSYIYHKNKKRDNLKCCKKI